MKILRVALLAMFAPALSTFAHAAADPGVNTVLEAVPTAVTLSRPAGTGANAIALETFAAYKFTIANGGSSALNRVFLDGTAIVLPGGAATATYDSFVSSDPNVSCSLGDAANKVHCDLPSLAPGVTSASVVVVFRAPAAGTQIRFDSISGGFEGNGVGNGCCSQPRSASTDLVDSLSTTFRTAAQSFVRQSNGGTVFTGNWAIPSLDDGWSTLVVVPSGFAQTTLGNYTVATIAEVSSDEVPTFVCPTYTRSSKCFSSALNIPGTFAALEITFRLDKEYFDRRIKPAVQTLHYTGDTAAPDWVTYPHELKLCTADDASNLPLTHPALSGLAPYPGRPCLANAPFIYSNGYSIRELRGDLEFNVRARDNGKYSQ